jgi:hypothetical protein
MMTRRVWPLFAASVLAAARTAPAAVPFAEDLSACKLPNGIVTLPIAASRPPAAPALLKLATGGLAPLPAGDNGQPLPPARLVDDLRASKDADLQYLPDAQGSLWAFSGRILELGSLYLSDAAGRQLSAPMDIPATSRNAAGLYPGVAEGRTYLVQTTDNRYALLRILEKTPTALVAQYVYQPSGALAFDVPRGDLVDFQRPAAAGDPTATAPAAAAARPAATAPAADLFPPAAELPRPAATLPPPAPRQPLGPHDRVEPGIIVLRGDAAASAADASLDNFLRQRDALIQRRLAAAQLPARTPADVEKKSQAIVDLGTLHATEAADVLAAQIVFFNPAAPGKEFSTDTYHPALGALKRLGKPATAAALRALKQIDLDAPGEKLEAPKYRAGILAMAVRAIEGDEVAEFLFRRELDRESDARPRAVFEFLLSSTPRPQEPHQ